MTSPLPGLSDRRLTNLMHAAIGRCRLDLSGLTVLTEAAVGGYVVTPVMAAMAGASRVYAMTRTTRYGTVDEVRSATMSLARLAGVSERVEVITAVTPAIVGSADIVTNSGHVRPIDAAMVAAMKPTAVIPLMFETWEFRPDDLDLRACLARGIPVGGTNERHPDIDVFSYLGPLAVKLITEAGMSVYRNDVLLVCNNPFGPFIEHSLRAAGANVDVVERPADGAGEHYDAVLVSLTPHPAPVLGAADAALVADRWPGAVVAQFWGNLDRAAFAAAGVPVWRPEPPKAGHMGILLSDLGPDSIVRLQSGGLKAGEVMWRHRAGQPADLEFVDVLGEEVLEQTCHECC